MKEIDDKIILNEDDVEVKKITLNPDYRIPMEFSFEETEFEKFVQDLINKSVEETTVYVDLDGVINDLYIELYPDLKKRMWEQGFFESLLPNYQMIDFLELMCRYTEVIIITKCIAKNNIVIEKLNWLNKVGIKRHKHYDKIIFVPIDESKANYLTSTKKNIFLIDDYHRNLDEMVGKYKDKETNVYPILFSRFEKSDKYLSIDNAENLARYIMDII